MKIHVLPGDALAEKFGRASIEGETVICRESLIEGEVRAENLDDFWNSRAAFIKGAYGEPEEKYFQAVAAELEKLRRLPPGAGANLWFEYELFCQTNMWFCLFLLRGTGAAIYRVAPVVRAEKDVWKGFGGLGAEDLNKCFAARVKFGAEEVALGARLWRAYAAADYEELERLAEAESNCFPRLKEVCRAEIEKRTRPKEVLREIAENGPADFPAVFTEFSRRAGVYGFGDAQVKRMLGELSL